MAEAGHRYRPGDRILVTGGYDGEDSDWLCGGDGYPGVTRTMTADKAAVELDAELVLEAREGTTWQDFGTGSFGPLREVKVARGRWVALMVGWVGADWTDPIPRLHVGLCEQQPDLYAIPSGGGIGYWVESHAHCVLLEPAE